MERSVSLTLGILGNLVHFSHSVAIPYPILCLEKMAPEGLTRILELLNLFD